MDPIVFMTKIRTSAGETAARRMIASLRTFGGELNRSPVWVFVTAPPDELGDSLEALQVRLIPLEVPAGLQNYPFGDKVFACAQAEELALPEQSTLVWIDPTCLVIQPPRQFVLDSPEAAAFRPVHIRNVGLPVEAPLDAYWSRIYRSVGITDTALRVESFVDRQQLRLYLNTHAFAVDPARGWLRQWLQDFSCLVADHEFQSGPGADELHRVFLHQAVLCARLAAELHPGELRLLPPEYTYPYHLHAQVPPQQRARALNDLVIIALEDQEIDPGRMEDIEIRPPLRTWLVQQLSENN